MRDKVWVELVGQIIIARVRGALTVEVLKKRHARILQLAKNTGCKSVLFDALESDAPSFDACQVQRTLNHALKAMNLRIAIVVPNSRLAYLARLVFDEENYRVIYNDMAAAVLWLTDEKTSILPKSSFLNK